jgi:hypothetical protein
MAYRLLRLYGLSPLVGLLLCDVPANPVTLLDTADELVLLAGNLLEIVVGQLAPLFANSSFHLSPVTFYGVPIHGFSFPHYSGKMKARPQSVDPLTLRPNNSGIFSR